MRTNNGIRRIIYSIMIILLLVIIINKEFIYCLYFANGIFGVEYSKIRGMRYGIEVEGIYISKNNSILISSKSNIEVLEKLLKNKDGIFGIYKWVIEYNIWNKNNGVSIIVMWMNYVINNEIRDKMVIGYHGECIEGELWLIPQKTKNNELDMKKEEKLSGSVIIGMKDEMEKYGIKVVIYMCCNSDGVLPLKNIMNKKITSECLEEIYWPMRVLSIYDICAETKTNRNFKRYDIRWQ